MAERQKHRYRKIFSDLMRLLPGSMTALLGVLVLFEHVWASSRIAAFLDQMWGKILLTILAALAASGITLLKRREK